MQKTSHSPPVRSDLRAALSDVDRFGVGVLTGCLSKAERDDVKGKLWAGVDTLEASGARLRGIEGLDPNESNVRLFGLVNLDQLFIELVSDERALAAVQHVIGDNFLISNFTANIALPGSGSMYLHADQGYVIPPWPPVPLAVNVAWVLDDYSDESGATRYVPDSHLKGRGPEPDTAYETVAIEAPAGAIIIMDGRVWHTSGRNRTASQERGALFAYYIRDWLRPQVNWHAELSPEVASTCGEEFLTMLGYRSGNHNHLNSGTNRAGIGHNSKGESSELV